LIFESAIPPELSLFLNQRNQCMDLVHIKHFFKVVQMVRCNLCFNNFMLRLFRNYIYLFISDLAPVMDDQYIPAKGGHGHWLF
jgi:hypothetical protein